MKRIFLIFAVAAASCAAIAQTPDTSVTRVEVERARITSERSEVEARYAREEVACYGKFAVNDCLNEARSRRRSALADLRRQEISINDAERKRKGAEAIKRIEEKNSPQKADEAAERRARAINDQLIREERAAKKAAEAADRQATARDRVKAQINREQTAAEKAAARASEAASTGSSLSRHEKRLKDAAERRERVEQKRRERTRPLSDPLPVPGRS